MYLVEKNKEIEQLGKQLSDVQYQLSEQLRKAEVAIPMLLWCPACKTRHIDKGEFADRAHHTHACQKCGMVWRPAIQKTVGVQFLPGFKNPHP